MKPLRRWIGIFVWVLCTLAVAPPALAGAAITEIHLDATCSTEGCLEPAKAWDWSTYHDPNSEYGVSGGVNASYNTFDGPIRLYRKRDGSVFTVAANLLSYFVPLDSDGTEQRVLTQADRLFHSERQLVGPGSTFYHVGSPPGGGSPGLASCVEPDYDHYMWLWSLWSADGTNFSALAHHEFYPEYCLGLGSRAGDWINAIHHLNSYVPGSGDPLSGSPLAFRPAPYTPYYDNGGLSNSSRVVLVPRPYSSQTMGEKCFVEGFLHPSNIVREGAYYYAMAGATLIGNPPTMYTGEADPQAFCYERTLLHRAGLVMIRTTNPAAAYGWQIRTSSGWVEIDKSTYQGVGGQEPSLFLEDPADSPFDILPSMGQNLTYSLTRHLGTGTWVALGFRINGVYYSTTASLADPHWSAITEVLDQDLLGDPAEEQPTKLTISDGNYASLVSPAINSGYNFQHIDDNPFLYFILPVNNSNDLHDRDIMRTPLTIGTTRVDPSRSHEASAEFASIQGTTSGWSYRTDAGTNLIFDAANNRWKPSSGDYPLVWNTGGHPGTSSGAVRRWTAHVQGRVNIYGSAWKADTTGGDGVGVAIRQSGSYYLWQRDLAYNDGEAQGEFFDLWIVLEVGEYVEFVITKGPSTTDYDSTHFDPTIEFTPHYAAADILAALAPVLQ